MSLDFKIAICVILASIPAYIWGYIFYKKEPEPRRLTLITFLMGMLAVIPILAYKHAWKFFPKINAFIYANTFQSEYIGIQNILVIPLSVIMTFMIVGVIEEYMKHLSVKSVDDDKFMNIDDAIEYSIIAALGFAFIENIMYFYFIWSNQGVNALFISFIFRAIFSTFAHILFSGLYGYYYGMAHFSEPIFREEMQKKRGYLFAKALYRLFRFRAPAIFADEKLFQGLLMAVALHAFFNIMLEMNWTAFMAPFLFIGYAILDHLFKKKDDHKEYGRLITKSAEVNQSWNIIYIYFVDDQYQLSL